MKFEDIFFGLMNLQNTKPVSDENITVIDTDFGGIPVRLFLPKKKSDRLRPAVINIHGGAFCLGSYSKCIFNVYFSFVFICYMKWNSMHYHDLVAPCHAMTSFFPWRFDSSHARVLCNECHCWQILTLLSVKISVIINLEFFPTSLYNHWIQSIVNFCRKYRKQECVDWFLTTIKIFTYVQKGNLEFLLKPKPLTVGKNTLKITPRSIFSLR